MSAAGACMYGEVVAVDCERVYVFFDVFNLTRAVVTIMSAFAQYTRSLARLNFAKLRNSNYNLIAA